MTRNQEPPPDPARQKPDDVLQVWRATADPQVFEDVRIKRTARDSEELSASAYDAGLPQRRATDPGPRRKG